MKQFTFVLCLLGSVLSACYTATIKPPPPPPPEEVSFTNHPSVFRGDWTASLASFPGTSDLFVEDIVATCTTEEDDFCRAYSFNGLLRVDDGQAVAITGEGSMEPGFIYTLTSEPPPATIYATFMLDETNWLLEASYRLSYETNSSGEPVFEGLICEANGETRYCSGSTGRGVRLERN